MFKLILSDNVAFLAFLLAIGAIVLFAVVLKKIMMNSGEAEEAVEEQPSEEQKEKPAEDTDTGLALIEAHLNVITQDIAELKQQVNSLETESMKKQLAVITAKIETISKVLSELAKE